MSVCSTVFVIFSLRMPSKHFLSASNTPEPDFPSVAPSLITGATFQRRLVAGSNGDDGALTITGAPGIFQRISTENSNGDIMRERVIPCGAATITAAPTRGGC